MPSKKSAGKNKILMVLILILAFSFLIRIYNIGDENLWPDEAVTTYNSHKPVSENVKWSLSIAYFPLYHIILSSWEKIFGFHEFSVRFLSVIFGTLSVYILYRIGSLMFNKKAGIFSAIIFAFSPFNVYYSQEARVYTLFVLLTLLSVYFYLKYIKSLKNRDLAYYAIFAFLMLNSHGSAIFMLIFQNMHYFLFVRKNFRKWIFIQSGIVALFLPLLFLVLKEMSEISQYLFVSKPGLITLMKTFYIFSAGTNYELESLVLGGVLAVIFFLLLVPVIINIYKEIKNKNYSKISDTSFILFWLAVPIFLLILQSYIFYSLYFDKYIIPSSIALYLLVAVSISKLKHNAQLFAVLSIILLSLGVLYIEAETLNKGKWKDTADYVRTNINPGDGVIIHIPYAVYSFTYYFDQECFTSKDLVKCMSDKSIYGVKNADELPADITEKNRVFLVLFNEKYIDKEGTLQEYFNANYELVGENKYRHVKTFIFEK